MQRVKKSIGKNIIIIIFRVIITKCFALITFPYTSRVLGPEYLGKVDFAQSVMTYFTLIAAFGIAGYAVREGARIRDDREKLNSFASEMLTLNLITVCVAYILFLIVFFIPYFGAYRPLLLAFCITIILNAIGMEWIYNIFEDYVYITVRALGFQILSVILLFTCVKDEQDYFMYALILVISSAGTNVLNFFRARKYVDIKINFSKALWRHIKPISLIFIMNLAASIYLIIDRSMLGLITGSDAEVGLYATAINLTSIISAMLTAICSVITPRVSYSIENDKKQVNNLIKLTGNTILMLAIPSAIGVSLLGNYIILLFAGNKFLPAVPVLRILMIEVIISGVNGFLINQLFISYRMDKLASIAVVMGVVANVIMNAITIPLIGKLGAAISTCLSELAMFAFVCIVGRKIFKAECMLKQLIQSVIAALPIVVLYAAGVYLDLSKLVIIATTIIIGGLAYFAVLFVLKNEIVYSAYNTLLEKILNKKKS